MELALLVWAISMLHGISVLLGFVAFFFFICVFLYFLIKADYEASPIKYKWPIMYGSIAILLVLVNLAIPSQKTAWIMVGAYATQQIAADPKVQQIGGKTLKLIEAKLDEYITEAEKAANQVVK